MDREPNAPQAIRLIRTNLGMYAPNGQFDHGFLIQHVVGTMVATGVSDIQVEMKPSCTVIETGSVWIMLHDRKPDELLTAFTDLPSLAEFAVRGEVLAAALAKWCCIGVQGGCTFSNDEPDSETRGEVLEIVANLRPGRAVMVISRETATWT